MFYYNFFIVVRFTVFYVAVIHVL